MPVIIPMPGITLDLAKKANKQEAAVYLRFAEEHLAKIMSRAIKATGEDILDTHDIVDVLKKKIERKERKKRQEKINKNDE